MVSLAWRACSLVAQHLGWLGGMSKAHYIQELWIFVPYCVCPASVDRASRWARVPGVPPPEWAAQAHGLDEQATYRESGIRRQNAFPALRLLVKSCGLQPLFPWNAFPDTSPSGWVRTPSSVLLQPSGLPTTVLTTLCCPHTIGSPRSEFSGLFSLFPASELCPAVRRHSLSSTQERA